jgi:anti-anti-sigma factor
VKFNISGDIATFSLQGRFDFSQYALFKEEQARALDKAEVKHIVLDFGGLDYLDSAALGILLVLLDKAKEQNQTVTIKRAKGVVREILQVAHFERMFKIED